MKGKIGVRGEKHSGDIPTWHGGEGKTRDNCVGQGKMRGNCVGQGKCVETAWGRENAWNPRGFIAPNPRKVRGVHELRGNGRSLMVYHY